MTILSWPHWSMDRLNWLLITRDLLPWLFCHGPIEAHYLTSPSTPYLRTSMTILSWPHWSVLVTILHFEPIKLPWLFCHGPIEASSGYRTNTRGRDFHDYFVMAPLKPVALMSGAVPVVATSMTILSWPHWSIPNFLGTMILNFQLPWLFCHGPIEARVRLVWSEIFSLLPWLFCHGPIEATCCVQHRRNDDELPWLFCHGPIEA